MCDMSAQVVGPVVSSPVDGVLPELSLRASRSAASSSWACAAALSPSIAEVAAPSLAIAG